jgi:hypothetical protein
LPRRGGSIESGAWQLPLGFDGSISIELEYSPQPEKIVDWASEAYRETNRSMQDLGIRG